MRPEEIVPVPWDTAAFGLDCYEITTPTEGALRYAAEHAGHYTLKLEPLADSSRLHHYGFYYVDTLITPVCTAQSLRGCEHADCRVIPADDPALLLPMCDRSFVFGRFHRDFNLPDTAADARYRQWLLQLCREGEVYLLDYRGQAAGFIACRHNMLVLHAMVERFRGRGLARYFWSEVCRRMFADGAEEVHSSVSAANLAAMNLYASLGFRFRQAVHVYHRLTR